MARAFLECGGSTPLSYDNPKRRQAGALQMCRPHGLGESTL